MNCSPPPSPAPLVRKETGYTQFIYASQFSARVASMVTSVALCERLENVNVKGLALSVAVDYRLFQDGEDDSSLRSRGSRNRK